MKNQSPRITMTAAARKARNRDRAILRRRGASIKRKLDKARKIAAPRETPKFTSGGIAYEVADRSRAIDCGGLGVFHRLALNSGLVDAIDSSVELLKSHRPYHESDHILNITYNILAGGTCLEDIELRRNDEVYLDALGTDRIPDPTTAGDFLRRFNPESISSLMEAVNSIRPHFWQMGLRKDERDLAIIDVDGTICGTLGERKRGMDISYKGIWGYHPLLVSLRNTQEVLYIENRSGNRPSHEGFVPWVDQAVERLLPTFKRAMIAGDTDFAATTEFDRWTRDGVLFVFGYDAMKNVVRRAQAVPEESWRPFVRREKHPRKGPEREKAENVKERIVVEREFKTLHLEEEHIAEFEYKPTACKERSYRMVVVRKRISVKEGQMRLEDEIRYHFYVSNVPKHEMTSEEVVFCSNDRCNQENLIEQMKNGLNAIRAPVGDLVANWAYMVIGSLAWTLKAWLGLSTRLWRMRQEILRMEFRTFVNRMVRIPAQIIKTGRRILYRLLGYNEWMTTLLSTFDRIGKLRFSAMPQ